MSRTSLVDYTVVIPTIGRPSLTRLLEAVADAAASGPPPRQIVVVDDRRTCQPLELTDTSIPITVLRSGGRGPAAARNAGWRAATTEWVAFLDDDVLVSPDWCARLCDDLGDLPPETAGSQAVLRVPPPDGRRPTDDERRTVGLVDAPWITADMAYRRAALAAVDGFDERFPRAFREDSDLALRIVQAGFEVVWGSRQTDHPLRNESWTASIRVQAGNADNALLRAKYGRHWRQLIHERPGRLGRHLLTTAAGTATVAAALASRPRFAAATGALWTLLTVQFAAPRVAAGPRTLRELSVVAFTSTLIPPVAVYHRVGGAWRFRRVDPVPTVAEERRRPSGPRAVLFDRDGTLIVNVPYLADPAGVQPVPGARKAVEDLRARDIRIGVVSNQSGVAKGLIDADQLAEVNARVVELLGPFDTWQQCLHDSGDGCECRKPAPGMVLAAAQSLAVDVADCVLIGDTAADAQAALAAGARAVLVTTQGVGGPPTFRPAGVPLASTLTEAVAVAVGASR